MSPREVGRRRLLLKIYSSLYRAYGPQDWWPTGPVKDRKKHARTSRGRPRREDEAFEIIIGAILTQNTAWTNVEKAIENLRSAGCLSEEAIQRMPLRKLARLIRPSGYFRVKARRVKAFVEFLYREYGGRARDLGQEDPAVLRRKLLSVSGVGPETADSILLYALLRPWFVVDAYTRRIFSRHGLVPGSIGYGELQSFFMSILPRDVGVYNEYHALLVRLGKNVCRPKPACDQCPLLPVLGEPVALP